MRALRETLREVEELLQSIAVAGLASPDEALPDELRALAEQAEARGLAGGAARIRALGAALTDPAGVQAATNALHQVLAWTRMFGRALDLAEVEANVVRGPPPPSPPTRTVRVWPLGVELSGAHLRLWGMDDQGQVALLRDEPVEISADDPLHAPSISRLFQDVVIWERVLKGGIELEDQPITAGRLEVRPAFDRRPRPIPRLAHPDPGPLSRGGPGWAELELRRVDQGIEARWEGRPVELDEGPASRGTLTKLLIRERAASVRLRALVVRRQRRLVVIAAEDPVEGEIAYPAVDPRAFPLSRGRVLQGRVGPGRILAGAAILEDPAERLALVEALGGMETEDLLSAARLELASLSLTGARASTAGAELPGEEALGVALRGASDRHALAALLLGASDPPALRSALAQRAGPLTEEEPVRVALVALLRGRVAKGEAERTEAQALLASHRGAWRERWASLDHPLPDPIDLLLIAWAGAELRLPVDPGVHPLPPRRLWARILDDMYTAEVEGEAADAPIADGLWLLAGGGWQGWIFA